MADVKWIKITTDMFDNRKIKYLRKLPDGDRIVLIWVMLLTMAGRCNSNGMIYLTENIPYTAKMLADELDFDENTIILALNALSQMGMIVFGDDKLVISGWTEYQNNDGMGKIREQNRKRIAEYRERKKQLSDGKSDDVTQRNVTCNVTVTQCNAIEEEKEEEKDIHSFTLLREDRKRKGLTAMNGDLGEGLVLLSEEQEEDLLDKLSLDEFNHYVAVVADQVRKGHQYKRKSHYQAILDMVAKDRAVEV